MISEIEFRILTWLFIISFLTALIVSIIFAHTL